MSEAHEYEIDLQARIKTLRGLSSDLGWWGRFVLSAIAWYPLEDIIKIDEFALRIWKAARRP